MSASHPINQISNSPRQLTMILNYFNIPRANVQPTNKCILSHFLCYDHKYQFYRHKLSCVLLNHYTKTSVQIICLWNMSTAHLPGINSQFTNPTIHTIHSKGVPTTTPFNFESFSKHSMHYALLISH